MNSHYNLRHPKKYPITMQSDKNTESIPLQSVKDAMEDNQSQTPIPSHDSCVHKQTTLLQDYQLDKTENIDDVSRAGPSEPEVSRTPDFSHSAVDTMITVHGHSNLGPPARQYTDTDTDTDTQLQTPTESSIKPASTDFNTILSYLQKMDEKSNTMLNEIKSELNANEIKSNLMFNEIKSELSNEIKACSAVLQSQIHDIKLTQNEFVREINEIKSVQLEHAKDIAQFRDNVTNQIENSQREIRDFVQMNITEHKTLVENEIVRQQNYILNTVVSKLEQQESKIEQGMKSLSLQTKADSENIASMYTQTLRNELITKISDNDQLIRSQQSTLQTISDILTKHETEVQTLKTNSQSTGNFGGPIQVIYTGGEPNECQLPKFNGRTGNPNEYLRKLKRYYEKSIQRQPNADPVELLKDTLEISFEGPASRWLQLIKTDIRDWNQFSDEFTAKYWSREVQRGIRNKIEAEKYRSNGNLSRAEYFTERALLLQSIHPPMSEEEIVILLAERFDPLIQDSRCVQDITTIRAFERLLQKEDIRDGPRKARSNNHSSSSNTNSTPSSPNKQNRPHAYYNNNNHNNNYRPYQPRNDYNRQNSQQPYYRSNQPNDQYNNYSAQNRNFRPYPNNGNNRHDYKPYQREPYQPHNNNNYRPKTERPYPTNEQSQVCAIIKQNSTTPNPSVSTPTRSDNNPTLSGSENGNAL